MSAYLSLALLIGLLLRDRAPTEKGSARRSRTPSRCERSSHQVLPVRGMEPLWNVMKKGLLAGDRFESVQHVAVCCSDSPIVAACFSLSNGILDPQTDESSS